MDEGNRRCLPLSVHPGRSAPCSLRSRLQDEQRMKDV